MTTESRSPAELERLAELEALLAGACARARTYDYDEPSDRAFQQAKRLLARLAGAFEDVSPFDVAVGVDGSIEVTGLLGETMLTVDVAPGGDRLDAVMDNDQKLVWVGRDISVGELLREITRAA